MGFFNTFFGNGHSNESETVKRRKSLRNRLCRIEEVEPREMLSATPYEAPDAINVGAAYHEGAYYPEAGNVEDYGGDTFVVSWNGGAAGTSLKQIVIDLSRCNVDGELLYFNTENSLYGSGSNNSYYGFEVLDDSDVGVLRFEISEDGQTLTIFFDEDFTADKVFKFKIDVNIYRDGAVVPLVPGEHFDGAGFTAVFASENYDDLVYETVFKNDYNDPADLNLNVPPDEWVIGGTDEEGRKAMTAGLAEQADIQTPKSGSLSGYVYEDKNNDGIKDASEPGIAGVELELYVWNGTEYVSTGLTATTNQNGFYKFADVEGGKTYKIVEVQPEEYLDGKDSVGKVDGEMVGELLESDVIGGIHLGANEVGTDYNFGELKSSSISGNVYHDRNNNGIQDENDEGIADVALKLQVWNPEQNRYVDVPGMTTTTDEYGRYSFAGLHPGLIYRVVEDQPEGWTDGKETVGTIGGKVVGSIFDAENDMISGIVLGYDEHGVEYNFGEYKPGSISGHVYEDDNNNGVRDEGEKGVAGVEIWLCVVDEHGNKINIKKTTTDANGYYSFDDLEPGKTYCVTEIDPEGYCDGATNVGDIDGKAVGDINENVDAGADQIHNIYLDSDQSGTNYNFGENRRGSLSGYVYHDANEDGVKNNGESGIQGVVLTLWVWDGSKYIKTSKTATTDENGFYEFTGLCPFNKYRITEEQPEGWDDGKESVGTIDGNPVGTRPGNDIISDIQLPPGGHGINYNFGEVTPQITPENGSLSGYVYVDQDRNGTKGVDEPGIPGVSLSLWVWDENEQKYVATGLTTTTNADGFYQFVDLDPNRTYMIVETQPEGYDDGEETVGSLGGDKSENDKIKGIVLGKDQHGTNYNFGELERETPEPGKGSLSGYVYVDANKNGSKDSGEKGIDGVTLTLYKLVDGVYVKVSETTTDSNGFYIFANLDPNETYMIVETQPTLYDDGDETVGSLGGDKSENDKIQGIALGKDQHGTNYNFGELEKDSPGDPDKGSLSGYVYVDANKNGSKDSGEKGIGGVTLTLYKLVDGVYVKVSETKTNSSGYYVFADLDPNETYMIAESQPTLYDDGEETVGSLGGDKTVNDMIAGIKLGVSEHGTNYNFGELERKVVEKEDDPTTPPSNNPITIPMGTGNYRPAGLGGGAGGVTATPTWQAPFQSESLRSGYGGGGLATGYSWHLSVVNAGYPRDMAAAEGLYASDTATQRTLILNGKGSDYDAQTRYVSVNWEPLPMDQGVWYVRDKDGKVKRKAVFGPKYGTPLAADFNGDGIAQMAVFKDGQWYIDLNGNGVWDEQDLWAELGNAADQPIVGDWDGDGKADIGVFGPQWSGDAAVVAQEPGLPSDLNSNVSARPKNIPPSVGIDSTMSNARAMKHSRGGSIRVDVIDHVFQYGGEGDRAFVGDFSGDGVKKVGIYRNGHWYIDYNGNGQWDDNDVFVDCTDTLANVPDGSAAIPVVGDWDGDGIDNIGLFVNGVWYLDTTGDFEFDTTIQFGETGDLPVVGDFNGDGIDQLAIYRSSDTDMQFTQSESGHAPAVSSAVSSPQYARDAATRTFVADADQSTGQTVLPEEFQRHERTMPTPHTDVPLNR